MERYEDALREALKNNDKETGRWMKYKEENELAIENLDRFSKYLTVDVMVPIGQKAFMPGQLIHTNEVLVGHYQGYFSKCSAHKAKEICIYRLRKASEILDKLKSEENLWQNKLEKPYAEGVFPNMSDREIIEEYDEEKENAWREKHKIQVKLTKAREKSEREKDAATGTVEDTTKKTNNNEDEIFKMLEEAEIMEELENELDNLQIDQVTNETIRNLMAGEMHVPPRKRRQSHTGNLEIMDTKIKNKVSEKISSPTNDNLERLQGIVKKTDLNVMNSVRTNNNNRPNPELVETHNNDAESDEDDVDENEVEEIQIIKEQAKYLSALEQIGFYEYQIQIMRQKLLALPLKTQKDIEQKVHILNILETLEELLEMAEDTAEAQQEEGEETEEIVTKEITAQDIEEIKAADEDKKQQKRRISFSLQNETLEFCKNESVSKMLPKPEQKQPKRYKDVIKLDAEIGLNSNNNKTTETVVDRKQSILNKVEENLKFIEENQSTKDFQLVDKILGNGSQTLHIHLQHSKLPGRAEESIESRGSENFKYDTDNIPGTPADFYQFYLQSLMKQQSENQKVPTDKIIFTNAYADEDKVKVPLLKEKDRSRAYEDQRIKFCKPSTEAKSILRNRSAVEREKHIVYLRNKATNRKNNSKKKKAAPADEEEYMSGYYKVMNEVVEKPLTEPEPLPQSKYIDAHAPKKRVSRFKQTRSGAEKTT